MKNIWVIIFALFLSCKPCQSLKLTVNEAVLVKTINCPENGDCTIELIPNKTITFKKDNTDVLYPEITEGEKTLLKYTFKRKAIPNIQDSDYTEIIYAELNETLSEITMTDAAMKNIKLHFGRLCYCKGENGYFPIEKGEFEISKIEKNTIKIDLNFIIKEVPQIITAINESISLKSG
jgi:hypothetical protein